MSVIDHLFAKRYGGGVFLAALMASAREGHLCLEVGETVYPSFGGDDEQIKKEARPIDPIVFKEGNRYYLKRNFALRERFLHHFERLSKRSLPKIPFDDPTLDQDQLDAVRMALSEPLSIISGGPGTGKSYTASRLIEAFPGRVAVAAPTGKAAANLAHLKGCVVKTLHALLSKKRFLPFDLIVVDEGSMVDALLMTRLFEQVHDDTRLVFLGDRDQLPPVDTGHFFADLTKLAPTRYLVHCHRAELLSIVEMAQAIKRGERIPFEPLDRLPQKEEGVTLLTPLRHGPFGVNALNRRFQGEKGKPEPIIITKNQGAFANGQSGTLYPDGSTSFGLHHTLLPHYEKAYALSVHKSQGSEYERVWLIVPKGSEHFGREMLYTAVTRAKREIRIFADEESLMSCLNNPSQRLSLS